MAKAVAKINLLVVDDEVLLCASLSEICRQFGHTVRTATDGFSALAEIRHHIPQMLISDLHMPGMSGFELLSVVRRRFPAIRVIAMSSVLDSPGMPTGVAADQYYEKSGGLGDLLEMIESTITRGPRRTVARPHHPLAPQWVARNGNDATGESFVTLTCPECLRTFPQPLDCSSRQIHRTGCQYCHTEVDFAIVQPQAPGEEYGRPAFVSSVA